MLVFFLGGLAVIPLLIWLVGTLSWYVLNSGFPGRMSWRDHALAWGWPVWMAADYIKHRLRR